MATNADDPEKFAHDMAALHATNALKGFWYAWQRLSPRCQSPIEKLFLAAFLGTSRAGDWTYSETEFNEAKAQHAVGAIFGEMYLQAKIKGYRADFLIYSSWAERYVVIECDGHNYHERTPEQAAHDRKRDRAMAENGIRVLRFTGTEIYRDAPACARQAQEFAGWLAGQ